MKAMILAAGRGQRLKPLTNQIHKALIEVHGETLIDRHLKHLARIGVKEVIINLSYLADTVQNYLANGEKYNIKITYSIEPQALETGGGIIKALPLLGTEPFLLMSCDIWTDYPLENLITLSASKLAHLILVNNPSYHPQGDFSLVGNQVQMDSQQRYTYANIALLHPTIFNDIAPGKIPLGPILKETTSKGKVSGELYKGPWFNVGTQEQLQEVLKHNL